MARGRARGLGRSSPGQPAGARRARGPRGSARPTSRGSSGTAVARPGSAASGTSGRRTRSSRSGCGLCVRRGVSVQTPLPVRSPTTLTEKPLGASYLTISEVVLQRVGELALEVLLGGAADRRLAVALDVDVDGLPPLRVGARVGERIEHLLLRRVDVPLVAGTRTPWPSPSPRSPSDVPTLCERRGSSGSAPGGGFEPPLPVPKTGVLARYTTPEGGPDDTGGASRAASSPSGGVAEIVRYWSLRTDRGWAMMRPWQPAEPRVGSSSSPSPACSRSTWSAPPRSSPPRRDRRRSTAAGSARLRDRGRRPEPGADHDPDRRLRDRAAADDGAGPRPDRHAGRRRRLGRLRRGRGRRRWSAGSARAARRSRRVTSVCSGSFLLAAAGLLEGKRATTHWSSCAELARRHPEIDVDPNPIFVHDGDVWTSAGVTSGHGPRARAGRGRPRAARSRSRSRAGSSSSCSAPAARPSSAPTSRAQLAERDPLRELQGWIADNLDDDLRVEALAERAAMSPRNFARAFRARSGITPAAYVDRAPRRARPPAPRGRRRADRRGRPRAAASAPPRRCAAPSPAGSGVAPAEYRSRFRHPDPQLTQEEPTMQVAYLLYDRFTALDITGPHEVLNSVPRRRVDLRRREGRADPQRVRHALARRRRVDRRGPEPRHPRRPRRLRHPRAARARAAARLDPRRPRDERVDDLGLHRLPAARRRRAARRDARDDPLPRARPARRARRRARPRPRRRAGQDPHRRRRLVGHRHGPAPGPAQVRRRGRPGRPARHRVRPPAPVDAGSPEKAPKEIVDLVTAVFKAQDAGGGEAAKQPARIARARRVSAARSTLPG